jgi:Rrf2 family protein
MLTKAAQYAIRSTLYLASNSSEEQKVSVKEIAIALDAPSPFLSKLLQQLSKANLISSAKGPKGGFYISKADSKNSIWDVIHCIDGTDKFKECFLGLNQCSNSNPCSVHELVVVFRDRLRQQFKDKNIEQLAQDIKDGKEQVQFDFN